MNTNTLRVTPHPYHSQPLTQDLGEKLQSLYIRLTSELLRWEEDPADV